MRILSREQFFQALNETGELFNCEITEDLIFNSNTIIPHKTIHLFNCIFKKEVRFTKNETNLNIIFSRCQFNDRFHLLQFKCRLLKISHCEFKKKINTQVFSSKEFIIDKSSINHHRELQLQEFTTEQFKFSENQMEYDIFIKPQEIKKAYIKGSESNHLITFSHMEKQPIINTLTLVCNSNHRSNILIRSLRTKN